MSTDPPTPTAIASQYDHVTVERLVREGDRHAVYEVTVDGRRSACKVTDRPAILAREAAVLRAVGERTPVAVPQVVDAGEGWLLLEWIDDDWAGGTGEGSRGDGTAERLRNVGRTLARLHDATESWFAGHGRLELTGDGGLEPAGNEVLEQAGGSSDDGPRSAGGPGPESLAVARPRPWPDRFEEFLDEWAGRLAGTPDEDAAAAVREHFRTHREAFAGRPPVLVHGEPAPEHVHFDGSSVRALLDWEIAQAAPAAFDLAWAERDYLRPPFEGGMGARRSRVPGDGDRVVDENRRAALHEGYEEVRQLSPGTERRLEFYRAAFALRSLGLVEETATYGGVAGADLRRALRSYVFARLDAAGSA